MELDKNTRKFLKQVKKLEPDFNNGSYSYKLITENLKMEYKDVYRMCAFLKLQGLIEYEKGFNKLNMGFKLTYEGEYYEEFEKIKDKNNFIKFVFIPITLAIISYVIIELLFKKIIPLLLR